MTPPNDFATLLEGLISEIAAETNSFKRFGLIQQQDALLANRAPAIARLVRAAQGLSHGEDWNNGTHAKTHGYRQKLLDALAALNAGNAEEKP